MLSAMMTSSRSPYIHQLILPEVQLYRFDPTGEAAMDARAVQTHKHTQLVGRPVWTWGVQDERRLKATLCTQGHAVLPGGL